jgi:hypothetical protein
MTEKVQPVIDKVLAFKMNEVLNTLRYTAAKKGWSVTERERDGGVCRLAVLLPVTSVEFIFEVSRMEPRAISGSFRMPQTRLSVWTSETDQGAAEEIARALHIAFLRAGG